MHIVINSCALFDVGVDAMCALNAVHKVLRVYESRVAWNDATPIDLRRDVSCDVSIQCEMGLMVLEQNFLFRPRRLVNCEFVFSGRGYHCTAKKEHTDAHTHTHTHTHTHNLLQCTGLQPFPRQTRLSAHAPRGEDGAAAAAAPPFVPPAPHERVSLAAARNEA